MSVIPRHPDRSLLLRRLLGLSVACFFTSSPPFRHLLFQAFERCIGSSSPARSSGSSSSAPFEKNTTRARSPCSVLNFAVVHRRRVPTNIRLYTLYKRHIARRVSLKEPNLVWQRHLLMRRFFAFASLPCSPLQHKTPKRRFLLDVAIVRHPDQRSCWGGFFALASHLP